MGSPNYGHNTVDQTWRSRQIIQEDAVEQLYKLPIFATSHAKLLQPAEEHDSNEHKLPFVAPFRREPSRHIFAVHVRLHLPLAAVARCVAHSSICTTTSSQSC